VLSKRRENIDQVKTVAKAFSGAPQFVKYFGPVLDALHHLGGSGRPDEVRSAIAQKLGLSEQEQSEPLPSKAQPRFDNQVHWARFYLSKAGLLDASKRGVWALTDKGRAALPLNEAEARSVFRDVSATFAKSKIGKSEPAEVEPAEDQIVAGADAVVIQQTYREEVAAKLQSLSPGGFERFCQRLLRESGFQEVTVTGRSGDGGIDGIGILQVNALVSFKVLFSVQKISGKRISHAGSRL
jgi:restriction system protein